MLQQVTDALREYRLSREARVATCAPSDRSSAAARRNQRARRELEKALLAHGSVDIYLQRELPLAVDVAVTDTAALTDMRNLLVALLEDQKIRPIECRYTRDSNDPCKRIGMPYLLAAKKNNSNAVDGKRDAAEMQAQHERNGTMAVYCMDTTRRNAGGWRSPKLGAISGITVQGKMLPVRFLNPLTGQPVVLNWQDAPQRQQLPQGVTPAAPVPVGG